MKEATLKKKVELVDSLADKFEKSKSIVFINYLGLTVAEVSELRKKLYNEDCEMHVIKNNIIRRAAKKVGYDGLDEVLIGPNAVTLSADSTNAPRIVYDFLKKNKKLKVKVGVIEGKVTSEQELKVLAKLPNKDGMLSMLLSVLQAPLRNLACGIKAVAEKQEA